LDFGDQDWRGSRANRLTISSGKLSGWRFDTVRCQAICIKLDRHQRLECNFDLVENCGAIYVLQKRPYSRAVHLSLVKSLAQRSMTSRRTNSRLTANKST